jgi:hypothetical protein
MNTKSDLDRRKLMDWVRPNPDDGVIMGMLATTYELDPTFFESDFLPTFLGLGAWEDTSWANRVAMQHALARTDAAAVMMDARRFRGRPRSLHIEVSPAVGPAGTKLHSKVLIVVQERAIRLVVGSANLTASGYRNNREVVLPIVATAGTPERTAVVRSALDEMPKVLQAWWTPAADRVRQLAIETMHAWRHVEADDNRFVWSWSERPLLRHFTDAWPNESVLRVTIVSPFWSDKGDDGPVAKLLERLGRDRVAGAEVRLLTEAAPETQTTFRPKLPGALASWDASQFGVSGHIQAVDPNVLPEEVGGRADYRPARALHAKVVLVEGPTTALAYAGSANFTERGWGVAGGWSNIEAGVMMLRKGKARKDLEHLIPGVTGERVLLNGKGSAAVTVCTTSEDEVAWPTFLREVRLMAIDSDSESLELRLALAASGTRELFSISLLEGLPLLGSDKHATGALESRILETLLRDQRVIVRWLDQSSEFPINVDLRAREQLPVSPGSPAPGERLLLAYYQGRISLEDIYPPAPGEADIDLQSGISNNEEDSGVDTSQIQSYQIREFVEALQGVRDDLRRAAKGTEAAMKQAVLGEVSPVALAREARRAAQENRRSVTAGGFQLVEILACLSDAERFEVLPERQTTWFECLRRSRIEILTLLSSLIESSDNEFGPKSAFHRYRTAVLKRLDAT